MGGKQSAAAAPVPVDPKPISPRRSNRPSHEFLSESEVIAARSTWVRLQATQNMQAMGVQTFLRIFQLEPRTKDAFESFRTLTTDELTTNVLFRSHATRFMKAVEVTMNNLDALDVIIVPNLKHLGRLHTNFVGFHVEYLRAFEVAMEEVWSDALGPQCFSGDCLRAWKKIFGLITAKVMEGYNEALVEGKPTPSRRPPTTTREGGGGGGQEGVSKTITDTPLPLNGKEGGLSTTNGIDAPSTAPVALREAQTKPPSLGGH